MGGSRFGKLAERSRQPKGQCVTNSDISCSSLVTKRAITINLSKIERSAAGRHCHSDAAPEGWKSCLLVMTVSRRLVGALPRMRAMPSVCRS
jgi:hypothetical protein